MERMMSFVDLLSKHHFHHKIKHEMESILKSLHIFKDQKLHIKFIVQNKNTAKCCVFFKVSSDDNVLGEDITIMIKPDNDLDGSGHNVLRVIVQEGNRLILNKGEDKDDDKKPAPKRIFKRELKAVEKDIKKVMMDELLKHEKKVGR